MYLPAMKTEIRRVRIMKDKKVKRKNKKLTLAERRKVNSILKRVNKARENGRPVDAEYR